jgi:DNA-binding NarL/FixJ family response regulator
MDLNMPGMTGVEATRQITRRAADPRRRAARSPTRTRRDGRDPRRRVRLPAEGLVDPGADARDPRAAARRVARLADHRGEGAAAHPRDARPAEIEEQIRTELSDREIEVLKLIANGKDNAMIAAELHISPKTVKNHISNILMKLQIENRIQAAVYAVRSGIV